MKVIFKNSTNIEAQQLSKVLMKDELRIVMTGVFVDLKNSVLVATDAHVLVSYPIEIIENDSDAEGFIVPVALFNRLRWMGQVPVASKRLLEPEFVLSEDYAEVYFLGELVYRCRYIDGKYPNWQAVFPRDDCKAPLADLLLNMNIVKRLSEALPRAGQPNFKLTFYGVRKAVVVEAKHQDNTRPVRALIMPVYE